MSPILPNSVSSLGERALIEQYVLPAVRGQNSHVWDDDAAPFGGQCDKQWVISTDSGPRRPFLTQLAIGDKVDLGHFMATMSLSDMAAMGAKPEALVSALLLPNDFLADDVRAIVQGMSEACAESGGLYVGGDVGEAEELRIVTTAVGYVSGSPLRRNGGRYGDLIFISGPLGKCLSNYVEVARSKDRRVPVLRPRARVELGQLLVSECLGTSCLDMSDGFLASCSELSRQSECKVNISLESVPVLRPNVQSIEFQKWRDFTLHIGGDFELLITSPESQKRRMEDLGCIHVGYLEKFDGPTDVSGGLGTAGSVFSNWEQFRTKPLTDYLTELTCN